MRRRQITDMDIVTNTCAIRCSMIVAENLNMPAPAGGCLQNQRNEMGFGLMPLTQSAIRICARRIEIAQRH